MRCNCQCHLSPLDFDTLRRCGHCDPPINEKIITRSGDHEDQLSTLLTSGMRRGRGGEKRLKANRITAPLLFRILVTEVVDFPRQQPAFNRPCCNLCDGNWDPEVNETSRLERGRMMKFQIIYNFVDRKWVIEKFRDGEYFFSLPFLFFFLINSWMERGRMER